MVLPEANGPAREGVGQRKTRARARVERWSCCCCARPPAPSSLTLSWSSRVYSTSGHLAMGGAAAAAVASAMMMVCC
jgi:hypothetical protein